MIEEITNQKNMPTITMTHMATTTIESTQCLFTQRKKPDSLYLRMRLKTLVANFTFCLGALLRFTAADDPVVFN